MSVTCAIDFENSAAKVAYAGQLIRGTVTVKLQEETYVRGLYLRLFGEAVVNFPIYLYAQTHEKRKETYLDERITCLDRPAAKARLAAGVNCYRFECQLPTLIPSSVEDEFGHVCYTASIRFDEFWNQQPIHEEPFTVIKPLNLNLMPDLHRPFSLEHTQRFNYLCCLPYFQSDELKIVASVPQRGYTPGEKIHLQLNVCNESNVNIKSTEVRLIEEITFSSTNRQSGRRHIRKKLKTVYSTALGRCTSDKEKRKICHVNIPLPSIPPTNEMLGIIKISYKIEVKSVVGCLHKAPKIEIPITIGTHPIIEE